MPLMLLLDYMDVFEVNRAAPQYSGCAGWLERGLDRVFAAVCPARFDLPQSQVTLSGLRCVIFA